MTETEIEQILATSLTRRSQPSMSPAFENWQELEDRFECTFSEEFKTFISLVMTWYSRGGEILEASDINEHDSIELVYDMEMDMESWQPNMIPFYAIGNGDYFCLNANECPGSRVFYFYHERSTFESYHDSFESWLRSLPKLMGKS